MILKVLLVACLATILFSQDMNDDFLKELQGDLDKYSQIATDTKQNVDYMPYIVSVLQNEELTKLGILTLREALSLVPGVDLSIGMAGVKNPIFRGSNPFAMGQSKLIIDGFVVNDQMFGAYNQYLDMPIDIIQRIEVVRGPGSLLSGVNAYAGSIHVITKANRIDGNKKENSIFASFGSDSYLMGGFVGSYKDNDIEMSSDLFYQEHDKSIPAGPDRFGNSLDAPLWLENYSLGLSVSYKDIYIKGRLNKNNSGVSYGQSFSLSEDTSDYLDVQNSFLELGYKFDLYQGVEAKVSVGYFDEFRELQNKVMPDGSTMMMTFYPDGYYFVFNYAEQTFNESFELKISTIDNHKITAGVHFEQNRLKENIARHSDDNLISYSKIVDLLSNSSREHISVYIDDLIDISEKTSVQLGIKYDDFSDVENQLSPRFAIVHRYDDENIYKLMYTHSYREPSWREQYLAGAHYFSADPNVKPESVDAYEASYIRKFSTKSDIKFNIFYLQNRDQIHAQNSTHIFTNNGDNELYGLEAELQSNITANDKFYINYSYVDGSNVADALTSSAQNMVKLYYIYNLNNHTNISTIVKYVGDKERIDGDIRENVDEYLTTDFTLSYKYKPYDMTVSASMKNAFDVKYELPSPDATYDTDFQQNGRSFLVRLSKRF